jgi:hypothetical protein
MFLEGRVLSRRPPGSGYLCRARGFGDMSTAELMGEGSITFTCSVVTNQLERTSSSGDDRVGTYVERDEEDDTMGSN